MKLQPSLMFRQIHSQIPFKIPASFFSTENLPSFTRSSSLFDRVVAIPDPKASVQPLLEKWVKDGRSVKKHELRQLVRTLKGFRRYDHALEVSKWMSDRRYFDLAPNDMAVRLSLIHKVYSLEQAEYFFNNMSKNLKTYTVYSALLDCYVKENSLEKAEHLMDTMREMGMLVSSFPYNVLLILYSRTGKHDKIGLLVQEMEEKGIPRDIYTLRNLMAAYVASSNISALESVLNKIEESSELKVEWNIYSLAANGYLKVGLNEKALVAMQKMEQVMQPLPRTKMAVGFLLSLYAKAGNKNDLYRVWNKYKEGSEGSHSIYSHMITSLAKLDDLEGAEKIYQEWESWCSGTFEYDFRVVNRLISAYCNRGLLEKAESLIHRASEGSAPYASTWKLMALGYMKYNQMAKAVEMFKRALSVGRRDWKPDSLLVNACLDYLEDQEDLQGLKDIITMLKNSGSLTRDIYDRLMRSYIAAGKSVSEVVEQMKSDGFDIDKDMLRLLETAKFNSS